MFEKITNFADLRKAYREAARKAHPDMGGSTEEMQKVNADFEAATKRIERTGERFDSNTNSTANAAQTGAENAQNASKTTAADMAKYAEILQKLAGLDDIEIELVGSWLWVSGNTYARREQIKAAGLWWSSKHKAWYWHAPEDKCRRASKSDTFEDIKARHGAQTVRGRKPGRLTA